MHTWTWTADLNTGVAQVDEQHRQIVDCIRRLADAGERSYPEVAPILDDLTQVTVDHFRDEERLMIESGYRYFEAHKGIHDRLLGQLGELIECFRNGLDGPSRILELMENWLYMHIRNNDKGYVPAVLGTA